MPRAPGRPGGRALIGRFPFSEMRSVKVPPVSVARRNSSIIYHLPPDSDARKGAKEERQVVTESATMMNRIVRPATEAGDFGIFAIISDPSGAMIALWENKPH